MKRYTPFILISLGICLFIYVFYRTDRTVVNIALDIISRSRLVAIKSSVRTLLPLPDFIIYSLPEGLWVFAATLVSRKYYLSIYSIRCELSYIPILYALGLELVQQAHIWNGHFDMNDIIASTVCWSIAMLLPLRTTPIHLPHNINRQSFTLGFMYAIVFLSHVSN